MAYILAPERDEDPVGAFERYAEYLRLESARFPPSRPPLTIFHSGRNAHTSTAQKSSAYGQTKGSGVMTRFRNRECG